MSTWNECLLENFVLEMIFFLIGLGILNEFLFSRNLASSQGCIVCGVDSEDVFHVVNDIYKLSKYLARSNTHRSANALSRAVFWCLKEYLAAASSVVGELPIAFVEDRHQFHVFGVSAVLWWLMCCVEPSVVVYWWKGFVAVIPIGLISVTSLVDADPTYSRRITPDFAMRFNCRGFSQEASLEMAP